MASPSIVPTAFIDPPSPLAPLQDWQKFLADLEQMRPRSPFVAQQVLEARKAVSLKKQGKDYVPKEEPFPLLPKRKPAAS